MPIHLYAEKNPNMPGGKTETSIYTHLVPNIDTDSFKAYPFVYFFYPIKVGRLEIFNWGLKESCSVFATLHISWF